MGCNKVENLAWNALFGRIAPKIKIIEGKTFFLVETKFISWNNTENCLEGLLEVIMKKVYFYKKSVEIGLKWAIFAFHG